MHIILTITGIKTRLRTLHSDRPKSGMEMHSQEDNSIIMLQQAHCHTTDESITGVKTKDGTGNANSSYAGEPEKNESVGTLSSTRSISLVHGGPQSYRDNLLESSSQEFRDKLTPSQPTGKSQLCSQRKVISNGLSSKRCVTSEQAYSRITPSVQDNQANLHFENRQTSQSAQFTTCGGGVGSKSVITTGRSAQCQSHQEKSSNIYGVADGPLTIIGSWALQSASANMQSLGGSGAANDLKETREYRTLSKSMENGQNTGNTLANGLTGTNNGSGWQFQACAETLFQIRASHLVKLTCMLALVIAVFSVLFHSRIRALEEDKKTLLSEIETVKMHVQLLVSRMEDVVSLAIPPRSQQNRFATSEENQHGSNERDFDVITDVIPTPTDENNVGEKPVKKIVKRSATAGRTTKELMFPSDSPTINALNNETTASYGPKMDDWTISGLDRSKPLKDSRAVYLQIDGSSVNIKKARQLIGPWYLPNTGNDIGFNDLWYNHLSLDANGTSVVFQESGLYLISAQVFYQLQHIHNSKPTPMGYRIHLKKNGNEHQTFRRPITIAECVPSFPTTVYQTCFTQVAWFVEAQDEVYLEHFTDSLPMIEALRSGQTFLGLVKLN